MERFLQLMPKIELHAHLNGSLTYDAMLELGKVKYGQSTKDFQELCNRLCTIDGITSLSECFQKFQIAHMLTNTKQLLELAVFYVIKDFYLDNVIYVELRTTPKRNEYMSKKEYLISVLESIILAEKTFTGIQVKLIPSIDRSQGPEEAKDTVEIIISLLHNYRHIIKGIDFSGNPSNGFFDEYKVILSEAKLLNLKLTLHCGEIDNEKEIRDMLIFGMDRCGHGTFIENENLQLLESKRIPIECCLTSNIKCETVKEYPNHHFYKFFSRKLPVIICTDDCGIFNTTLTNELLIATNTFNLHKKDHLQLAYNAIEYSFCSNIEKLQLKNKVEKYFDIINFTTENNF